jgi:hypothetical protein
VAYTTTRPLMEHAALMLELFPDAQLAVLPGTTHMQVIRRTEALLALVEPFLDGGR